MTIAEKIEFWLTVATFMLVVATVLLAVFGARSLAVARAMRRDSLQPNVWVDLRPTDTSSGEIIVLVVGNSGPSVATDVRVTFDLPLPTDDDKLSTYASELAQNRLRRGIASLQPGRSIAWSVGRTHQFGDPAWADHAVVVTASGPFGEVPPVSFVLCVDDIRNSRIGATGTLRDLQHAVDDLPKAFDEQRRRSLFRAARPMEYRCRRLAKGRRPR